MAQTAGRLEALLGGKPARWAPPLLALAVALPTVLLGFYSDDWSQVAMLEGRAQQLPRVWDLYAFASGDPAKNVPLLARGPFPWFTDPGIKLHFFRPLTSLFTALDHALFGLSPIGYHLDCIAAYVACAAVVAWLFRKLLPGSPALACLAACLWAVDEAHHQPAGWIASRHIVVGGLPAIAGIGVYVAWRRDGYAAGRWLAPVLFAVALGGSESALGIVPFLLGYEIVFERRRGFAAAARAIAPSLAVFVAYAALYRALGLGSAHNGSYFDPGAQPLAFARAAALRYPILLADALLNVPSDMSNILPHAPFYAAAALGAAFAYALWRGARPRVARETAAVLAFLGIGAALAVVPGLGGFPGNRILFLPSLFTSVFYAAVLFAIVDPMATFGARVLRRAAFGFVVFLHGIAAPFAFVAASPTLGKMARGLEANAHALAAIGVDQKRVVYVNGSDPFTNFYPPAVLYGENAAAPRTWQILSMAHATHRVTRTSADRLKVELPGARMFDGAFEIVFRSAAQSPFRAGQEVELDGGAVTVLSVDGGAPTAIELRLDVPLDDPSVVVVAFRDGKPQRLSLSVGETLEIPWSPGPTGFF